MPTAWTAWTTEVHSLTVLSVEAQGQGEGVTSFQGCEDEPSLLSWLLEAANIPSGRIALTSALVSIWCLSVCIWLSDLPVSQGLGFSAPPQPY